MIGDKIKERRLELKITQAQLSELTNIKTTTISNYENNISTPNEDNIYKLLDALQCDANYLFEWASDEFVLSYAEKQSIVKYRSLDEHGKKVVDFILGEEYSRSFNTAETPQPKHLLLAGQGGSADVEIKDPEAASKELKKLQRKHGLIK